MLQTSALGALLTFAPSPWYADPLQMQASGLSPLEDQQLGGLVMWVPGALAYIVVALWIVARWLARPSPARFSRGRSKDDRGLWSPRMIATAQPVLRRVIASSESGAKVE